jgi:hypothetical protein
MGWTWTRKEAEAVPRPIEYVFSPEVPEAEEPDIHMVDENAC